MTEPWVVCRIDAEVATLTLNRPAKLNALTAATFTELRRHLDDIACRSDVRCVILTGAGRSFCAGHSLDALREDDAADSRFAEGETIDVLEALPVPTIAKIRGHCLTGGLELALGCDLLIASQSSVFADTHGEWGLVPVWGMSVRLAERIGRSAAKELSFTSRQITTETAVHLGLVDRCVPDQELDAAVETLAAEILANSAGSNRIMKQLYLAAAHQPRTYALHAERALVYGTPSDADERVARFQKRSQTGG